MLPKGLRHHAKDAGHASHKKAETVEGSKLRSWRKSRLTPIRSTIELQIDPPPKEKRQDSKKKKKPTRTHKESEGESTDAELKVKDVKPQQMLKLIRGLLIHKQRKGGKVADLELISTTTTTTTTTSTEASTIELSLKSLLNVSSSGKNGQKSETPPKKPSHTPERIVDGMEPKLSAASTTASLAPSSTDSRGRKSSPTRLTTDFGLTARKDSKRSKMSSTGSLDLVGFQGKTERGG